MSKTNVSFPVYFNDTAKIKKTSERAQAAAADLPESANGRDIGSGGKG